MLFHKRLGVGPSSLEAIGTSKILQQDCLALSASLEGPPDHSCTSRRKRFIWGGPSTCVDSSPALQVRRYPGLETPIAAECGDGSHRIAAVTTSYTHRTSALPLTLPCVILTHTKKNTKHEKRHRLGACMSKSLCPPDGSLFFRGSAIVYSSQSNAYSFWPLLTVQRDTRPTSNPPGRASRKTHPSAYLKFYPPHA